MTPSSAASTTDGPSPTPRSCTSGPVSAPVAGRRPVRRPPRERWSATSASGSVTSCAAAAAGAGGAGGGGGGGGCFGPPGQRSSTLPKGKAATKGPPTPPAPIGGPPFKR